MEVSAGPYPLAPRCKLVQNSLTPWCAFQIRKIGIEVAGHQDLVPVRLDSDGHIDVLYGRGVAGGNIAPHDMPPTSPNHQRYSVFGVLHRSGYHLYLICLPCFEWNYCVYVEVDETYQLGLNWLYIMYDLLKIIIQLS